MAAAAPHPHAIALTCIKERTGRVPAAFPIDNVASLSEELATIRRRDYAIDDEEHAIGVRCRALESGLNGKTSYLRNESGRSRCRTF